MEIRDGFVDGIYSYCDRWCETCAFTSWCQLFADSARDDAADDPNLKPVIEAPPLPHEVEPEPPPWMQEMIAEIESAAVTTLGRGYRASSPAPSRRPRPAAPRPRLLNERASLDGEAAGCRAPRSRRSSRRHLVVRLDDLREDRPGAVEPRTCRSGYPDCPRDHDGSAKVALIGIERSHAAWLRLADEGTSAFTFISDLVWIGEAVEREFPGARSFVRPAFDEPDAVARLRASGG